MLTFRMRRNQGSGDDAHVADLALHQESKKAFKRERYYHISFA